jgi:hypothetical protein
MFATFVDEDLPSAFFDWENPKNLYLGNSTPMSVMENSFQDLFIFIF